MSALTGDSRTKKSAANCAITCDTWVCLRESILFHRGRKSFERVARAYLKCRGYLCAELTPLFNAVHILLVALNIFYFADTQLLRPPHHAYRAAAFEESFLYFSADDAFVFAAAEFLKNFCFARNRLHPALRRRFSE